MKIHILLFSLCLFLFSTSPILSQETRTKDYNYVQLDLDTSSEKISVEILDALCDDELVVLRNEIYARHGYIFASESLQNLFKNEKWYHPQDDNKNIKLSEIESYNVSILKEEEKKRNERITIIKAYFLQPINTDQNTELDKQLISIVYETVIPHIQFNNLHFCKDDGIYQAKIDNGFSDMTYYLKIDSQTIRLGYQSNGVSTIYPSKKRLDSGIEEGFSAMARADENILEVIFTINENNEIEFDRISAAG